MVDVFVSYKAEDRKRVVPMVKALEADGLSVWWDAHIGGGVDWRESIEENLKTAKCVVVVWSKRSVAREGRFVRDEASRAQRRDAYLPVRIDKVEPPLGFGETQAISLAGWSGDPKDDRYQAVLEAVRALISGSHASQRMVSERPAISRRAVLAGGGAVAVAAAGGWYLLNPARASAQSIAVLPFANLSGDPSQTYFADGLAEEVRAVLARIPRMRVMARMSSEMVRDDDVQTAAEKLDVETILAGSVRKSPSTIRINVQLVDGTTGLERWSEVYDRPTGDVLDVQTDIAQKVASALRLELADKGDAAMRGRSQNAAAQDLLMKARAAWQGNPSAGRLREALSLFDEAIRLDPSFAEAHAQKAIALMVFTQTFATSSAEYSRDTAAAEAEAQEALKIAPGLTSAFAALAMARAGKLEFKAALADYQKAFEDGSHDTDGIAEYSRFLSQIGFASESFDWAGRAISADPLNGRAHQAKVYALFCSRQFGQAIAGARDLLKWSPGRATTLVRLGESLILTGKPDEALAAYRQCDPDYPPRIVGEAILAAKSGNRQASDAALARLKALYGERATYRVARVHAQRGETALAFAFLAEALKVRHPGLANLPTDPWMDPLRDDPRFNKLLGDLRFP